MHVSWIKSPENEGLERTEYTGFIQSISWIIDGGRRKKIEKEFH